MAQDPKLLLQDNNKKQGIKVLGLGNPLLDISAHVDEDFLKKYDLRLSNAILADEKHLPIYAELLALDGTEFIAGGATLNTIRVAQWMSQEKGFTGYGGCIGKDIYGEKLVEAATNDGVECDFMINPDLPTGTCAVCIVDKERSLVANLGAANTFKSSHLEEKKAQKLLKSAQVVYSAGYFSTASPESQLIAAQHCAKNNKPFALNFSAEFIVTVFKDKINALLPLTTHLFSNEEEAKAYAKAHEINYKDTVDLAKQLSLILCDRKEGRTVIITQGKDPVVVAHNGKANEYQVEALEKEKIVDLNGAGDAFVGGYLSQLALGKDEETCVKAGNYASRYIIQTSGVKLSGKPDF